MKKIWLQIGLACGLVTMLLAGCGGDEPAPEAAPRPAPRERDSARRARDQGAAPADAPATGASAAKLEKLKDWVYNPETKWDPFVVPEIAEENGGPGRFDVDQMVLYGVVRGSGMDRAFIRLPDNSDRIVRVGDVLGKHNGRVVRIEADSIVVEEKYYDPRRPDEIFVINKVLPLVRLSK